MKIDELLERLSDYKGDLIKDLSKLEKPEIDRIIATINDFTGKLEERKRSFEKRVSEKVTPKLLTVRQAAKYLQVSEQTIYNNVKSGNITCHRIGRSIRFSHEDLNLYFSQIESMWAICNISNLWINGKTLDIIPFETNHIYKIVSQNRIWIYLFSQKWGVKRRIGNKDFGKYFSVAEELHIDSAKYNVGINHG